MESEEHPESCDGKERPRKEKQEDCEKAEPSSEPLVKGEAVYLLCVAMGNLNVTNFLQKFLKKQVVNCMKWSCMKLHEFWGVFVPSDVSRKREN